MIEAMSIDALWELAAPGPYPRRGGNQVTPWIDGLPFYTRLAQAFRAARSSIWAIVSFIEPGFRLPDGTPWWELLAEAQARGVDVRVLFWRNPSFFSTAHVFLGGPEERAKLRRWDARWAARWDSSGADPNHCHHQKAYVVDGLGEDPIAFIGGMVLSTYTLAERGHHRGPHKHDAFLELRGPAVVDAEHNFIERWNHANADPEAPPWPDPERAGPLPLPERVPPPCGALEVQLARTLRAGLYADNPPETTILAHYREAFRAARRTIYMENQHPGHHELLELLAEALARGVEVVLIVPGVPMAAIYRARAEVRALPEAARASHRYGPTFAGLDRLGDLPGFTLAALARSDPQPGGGHRLREIYTHAKLCIVDGEWLTLGSANFVDLSLDADHSELNAAVWGEQLALPLLRSLCAEHIDLPEAELEACDDRACLVRLREHARASRASLDAGGPVLGGCRSLDPRSYALLVLPGEP